MNITVNGQNKETSASRICDLLEELKLLPTQVAIELNGTVLFRHEYSETNLKEADKVEIVRVVAGG
jgi:thiamine biosynthesis protein ThiS